MGFFNSRLVDPEVAEWQFEHFEWLIDNFSSGPGLPESELWRPIAEHYPSIEKGGQPLTGRALAKGIFKTVKQQCHFGPDQVFRLTPTVESKPQSLGGVAMVQTNETGACGRYIISRNEDGTYLETITYDKDLIDNPAQLIATFAHELSHALHNRSEHPVEIENELYEMFTDLTAIYLGFGIFTANSRFEFSQFQDANLQGWKANGSGYLPEADIIFATALFMRIKSIPIETGIKHLKPRLKKMLNKAFRQLVKYEDDIKALRLRVPLGIQKLDSENL